MPLVNPRLTFSTQSHPTDNLNLLGVASISQAHNSPYHQHLISIMTAKWSNFSSIIMSSNLSSQPENELLPESALHRMNNKIEPSAVIFRDQKALTIILHDMGKQRRLSPNHNPLGESSLAKKRRYQRRNSKVASMLASSVKRTLDGQHQSLRRNSTTANDCSGAVCEDQQHDVLESVSEICVADDDDSDVDMDSTEGSPPTKRRKS